MKAILFDLGGTLFDFRPMSTRIAFQQGARSTYAWLQARGHVLPPYPRYFLRQYVSMCGAYLWSRLRGREFNIFDLIRYHATRLNLNLDEPTLQQLAWEWYAPVLDYCTVHPDVVPTLAKLRDRGLKLAIVSNTFLAGFVLDRHMALHNLLDFFPTRIYSSELGRRKPHPSMFNAALSALDVSPADALFIGDNVAADIKGARRVGLRAILRHPNTPTTTHPLAHHVIRQISDLLTLLPHLSSPTLPTTPPTQDLAYET